MILRIDYESDRLSVTSGVTDICLRKLLRKDGDYTHKLLIKVEGQKEQDRMLKEGDTVTILNENTNDVISFNVIQDGSIQEVEDEDG